MNILSIDVDWVISSLHQQSLTKLFYNKVRNVKNIYFANHHNSILNIIPSKENINLFNIDHHHDICYDQEQDYQIKQNFANMGSWIGLLLNNNILSSLNWVRNVESDSIKSPSLSQRYLVASKIPFKVDYTLDHLYNEDYDTIFVCRSEEYINESYRILYDTLMLSCLELYPQKTAEIKLNPDNGMTLLTLNND